MNRNTQMVQSTKIDIDKFMKRNQAEFARVLPRHISVDKMMRIVLGELRRNPKLQECSQSSLGLSILNAASLGLFPDSLTGQAYLVPYGKECQLIVGYKGFIALAYRSKLVTYIDAHEVYSNDEFEYSYGSQQHVFHKPAMGDRGELVCFYAIAKLFTGETVFRVLSVEEVNKVRASSAGKTGKAWTNHFEEMGKKSAIRRVAKYLPQSADDMNLAKAIALDERYDAGESIKVIDGEIELDAADEPQKLSSAQNLVGKLRNTPDKLVGEIPSITDEEMDDVRLTYA